MRAHDFAADRCPIADMTLRLGGGELLGLSAKIRNCQQTKSEYNE
jgi:hypothetical protein